VEHRQAAAAEIGELTLQRRVEIGRDVGLEVWIAADPAEQRVGRGMVNLCLAAIVQREDQAAGRDRGGATGAGLYMAYMPFNAMLFDRMIAFSGRIGTAGFLIYVADALGYLGSVALLVWRNFVMVRLDWLGFFIASAYATSVVGAVCTILAGVYFLRRRSALEVHVPPAATVEDAVA